MHEDQAAGLRRLFPQQAARMLLVADAAWPARGWMALNLAAAFSRAGEQVVLLDAERDSVAGLWGARCRYELAHVLAGDRRLVDAIVPGPEASVILPMRRAGADLAGQGSGGRRVLGRLLESFVEHDGLLIVPVAPARLESQLWRVGAGDVLLCAGEGAASLTRAYATIKAMHSLRPQPGVRMAFASGGEDGAHGAWDRFSHMQDVARRFLDMTLGYAGVFPAAEFRHGMPGRTLFDYAPAAARCIEAIARDAAQWRLPQLEFNVRPATRQIGEGVTI